MDSCLSIVCDITAALVPRGFQDGGPGWVLGGYALPGNDNPV
ncbi:hypothetical protein vBPaePP1G_002 [Pseudomonas phage vB_PaeP_P1G]|uniref:Uncharacterized protein n=1 Tax=Pseudomonas phage vB_PaeP_P1G TaxID=3025372 RepID=A0AAF0BWG6_9CAUD|nr:hypothetical protein vBPaePP1G_002 [Pseudomonas phage vB_PaeP_P1G]